MTEAPTTEQALQTLLTVLVGDSDEETIIRDYGMLGLSAVTRAKAILSDNDRTNAKTRQFEQLMIEGSNKINELRAEVERLKKERDRDRIRIIDQAVELGVLNASVARLTRERDASQRAEAAATAKERERCASIAETLAKPARKPVDPLEDLAFGTQLSTGNYIARAIREGS